MQTAQASYHRLCYLGCLKGPEGLLFKGGIDVDLEVDVDIDSYLGCLEELSKLVQFNGIAAVMVLSLLILK